MWIHCDFAHHLQTHRDGYGGWAWWSKSLWAHIVLGEEHIVFFRYVCTSSYDCIGYLTLFRDLTAVAYHKPALGGRSGGNTTYTAKARAKFNLGSGQAPWSTVSTRIYMKKWSELNGLIRFERKRSDHLMWSWRSLLPSLSALSTIMTNQTRVCWCAEGFSGQSTLSGIAWLDLMLRWRM